MFTTRFAPSPTGRLHLGHAFSAWLAWDAATRAGGRFLLRIEDIDAGRCRPEFEAGIYEELAWLGLVWEQPARRQSDHLADYAAALSKLRDDGLAYRCFRTRREVAEAIASAPHGAPSMRPVFLGGRLSRDEEEDRLSTGAPFAWRLDLRRARDRLGERWNGLAFKEEGRGPTGETGLVPAEPDLFGDEIIARKDAGVSYHLAAVHDDALQGVSHVIRGEDLFASTHFHVLLQALLELPTPIYRHHRLITDADGKRFAKRDRSVTLEALREAGSTPSGLRGQLGMSTSENEPLGPSRTHHS